MGRLGFAALDRTLGTVCGSGFSRDAAVILVRKRGYGACFKWAGRVELCETHRLRCAVVGFATLNRTLRIEVGL